MQKETEVIILGAGPGGMQAAHDLSRNGIDNILIDKSPGVPEAPIGCVTIPRRSKIFGHDSCGALGNPETRHWETEAECEVKSLIMAGPKVIGRFKSREVLAYNFSREKFWQLMLKAVKDAGSKIVKAEALSGVNDKDKVILKTDLGEISAKALIYSAGIRTDPQLPDSLGLKRPPVVHGLFGSYKYDGEWLDPPLSVLWNQNLIPHGYFWCGLLPKSRIISIGIINNKPVEERLLRKFINSGMIPSLKKNKPDEIQLEVGVLGAVSHVNTREWPVPQVINRTIAIGEATGAIASYIYEGIFASRYQGHVAANVLSEIKNKNSWNELKEYKKFLQAWKPLDNNILHFTRVSHYGLYHGSFGTYISDGYSKALNKRNRAVVDSIKANYLKFEHLSKYELGIASAILSNVPFLMKFGISTSFLTARMQK
ncbi:MAG: NAD(P)/FAD-dependent oxidoreductase [Promethearchaeota archaeon]